MIALRIHRILKINKNRFNLNKNIIKYISKNKKKFNYYIKYNIK